MGDAVAYVHQAVKQDKTVLLEGQLGSMKDPNLGICPFTTSSHTLAGFGTVGGGVPATALTDVICVSKAYSSAVGAGAFSELFGEQAQQLRLRGGDKGEFGATTGRPRRVGWYDAVASRYGCMVQGATEVALTAIDCLGYLDELQICTGYEIDGQVTREFPVPSKLERAKPVYTALPGWKCDLRVLPVTAICPRKPNAIFSSSSLSWKCPSKLFPQGQNVTRSSICTEHPRCQAGNPAVVN